MPNLNDIKNKILNYMKDSDQKRFEMNDLSHGIKMDASSDFKNVVKAVAELERDGAIILSERGLFMLPDREGLVEGKFRKNHRGFGFVEIEDWDEDVFIPAHRTHHAMEADQVLISIDRQANPKKDKGPEGTVQEIIEHGTTHLIASFHSYGEDQVKESGYYGYAEPQDKTYADYRIFILDKGLRPKNEAVCLVEIVDYPDEEHEHAMTGVVTTEIGQKDEPGVDILAVVYKHGIPTEFSKESLAEADAIPDRVTEEEKEGRLDLRELKTITIDGADAKDLDDAISLEKLDNGNYYLGVHIADVSHYVQKGTALDQDAFERGTSSYLTDRVIPMLPQKLSNGICSLHPNVERLALSCFMEIDSKGQVKNYKIEPSVIISDQRMTYEAVNGILEDGNPKLYKEYADYITLFEDMRDLHQILESKRYRRGAINFDTEEASIIVDEEGHPIDIQMRERGVGERIIESFMLQANETVSKHHTDKHLPILYRVHEQPDQAKIQSFVEFAQIFGLSMKGKLDHIQPKQLQGILESVDGKDEDMVISMTLLRSMQQARYDVEPLGHFGLAAEFYSHFTSPIRRYPDLILHRLIHLYSEGSVSKGKLGQVKKELPQIAEHSSMAERRAIDAEREVDNMKKVEYMADKQGQEFPAVIVSVMGFGLFVQLENTIEGLVHVSSMDQDYFEYNEQGKMMIGQHTGLTYRMGDKVRVRLVKANVEDHQLDFELVVDETDENKSDHSDHQTKNEKASAKNQRKNHGKKNRKGRRRAKKKKAENSKKAQEQKNQTKSQSKKKTKNKRHFKIKKKKK